jgi:uncharacterized protein (TIGR03086 family)
MDTDPTTLYRDAAAAFEQLVDDIAEPDWSAPTACPGWTVRDLVGHVVEEDLWAQGLFAGLTLEQAGARLSPDPLGKNPADAYRSAVAGALAAAGARDVQHHTVHLSAGETPAGEYAMQLFADHLVHAWDLAAALARPYVPDPAHVRAALDWFGPQEDAYRAAGLIGPRPPLPAGADDLTTLLAAFGRTP